MSKLIDRWQTRDEHGSSEPGVFAVDSDAADETLDALGTETTRRLFAVLFEEPKTASELASIVDTSVQNVNYHLSKLTDAGLVEAVDSQYSEKGYEMKLYAPVRDPVVFVGEEEHRESVELTLTRTIAGVALLVLGGIAVQVGASVLDDSRVGAGVVEPASVDGPVPSVFSGLLEPGIVFIVGCLAIATAVIAVRRYQ